MVEPDSNCGDVHVHDTTDPDDQPVPGERTNGIEELDNLLEEDMTIQAHKIAANQDKVLESPAIDLEVSSPSPIERALDVASVRSLPIVQVTEPASPGPRPSTARDPNFRSGALGGPDGSSTPPSRLHRTTSTNHDRRRSTYIDNRSTNRFSGFFSNLIHRRDAFPTTQTRQTVREGRPESPAPGSLNTPSRPSSPAVSTRPITPPPALPPPTLNELGLSMSVLTPILSPAHYSSPPSSGAYLSPHYLLLCHAQGLDVLPLVSPPAPVPYALVRRVPFKLVVVMEQRGVLVAIAGRRDGVRVYALDEVRKAVEWRIDFELRRERDKARREEAKRIASGSLDGPGSEFRSSDDIFATITPVGSKNKLSRKLSRSSADAPNTRSTITTKVKPPPLPSLQLSQPRVQPEDPPSYTQTQMRDRHNSATAAIQLVHRSPTINNDVISRDIMSRKSTPAQASAEQNSDVKPEWLDGRDSSDEEAIDIVAAGVSGGQALDERTSAMAAVSSPHNTRAVVSPPPRIPTSPSSRRRPANLDISLTRVNAHNSSVPQPPPSPTPTLLTLRQALQSFPSGVGASHTDGTHDEPEPATPDADDDDFDGLHAPTEHITLAQALMESRLPNLPPVGTRQAQQPILISSHPIVTGEEELPSPRGSGSTFTRRSTTSSQTARRRRWSVFDGLFLGPQDPALPLPHPSESNIDIFETLNASSSAPREPTLARAQSRRTPPPTNSTFPPISPSTRPSTSPVIPSVPVVPSIPSTISSGSRSGSRFIPRVITNVFQSRRSTSHPHNSLDSDRIKAITTPTHSPAPAPKLEYVKLPGTKGALLVKAVETGKKSFLAILCGEHGEKVELFAGTYRTALGLSRTFILPDSPRSLELQLQGDDLVEVFLVFSQNVFGLEPATVRVREVRIGRAERRAARRRARDRENLLDEPVSSVDPDAGIIEDDTNITVSVSVATAEGGGAENETSEPGQSTLPAQHVDYQQSDNTVNGTQTNSEELTALAAAQISPYTTFQQLSFAPNFPLASIADEYIIPPTYKSFMEYRDSYESEAGANDLNMIQQLPPPGLPPPAPSAPSKWYYRDPKGVIQGPWKSNLMQSWYKDGLLPPDLPVRSEDDTEYILLKDLRLQCVDPSQPFGCALPQMVPTVVQTDDKPLLRPISLLAQPAHYGPPALFFSSRGGHSTTIVDGRGRLVLKGRFLWSQDKEDGKLQVPGRMGDVKRLEAIDIDDRSILVAMRQGGLEAVDLTDALLRPADGSRTLFPHFNPPSSSFNRRRPFVWRMGTPISSGSTSGDSVALKPSGSRGTLKKLSNGPGKTSGRPEFSFYGETDGDYAIQDEILYLGRKDDALYLCERNSGSFRILRLCPTVS